MSPAQAETVDCTDNIAGPCVSSVSPSSGSTAGGTVVAISGVNLLQVQQVWFGSGATGKQGKILDASATAMRVQTPAHVAGTVEILFEDESLPLINPDTHHFTFVAPPLATMPLSVSGKSPSKGVATFTGKTRPSAVVTVYLHVGQKDTKVVSRKASSTGTFTAVVKPGKGKKTFKITAVKTGFKTVSKYLVVTVK